jgi:4-diphosphocytidyl-2-C-methyl-D-erythritol kinase
MRIEREGHKSLKIFTPAKLNLFLEVRGKRADGYHTLDTLMHSVDLYDVLTIRLIQGSPKLKVLGRETGPLKDNLVFKSLQLFNDHLGHKQGFDVTLDKKIPVGAGLGGGSSDCAATLIGCNELMDSPFSRDQLLNMGCSLGSDVSFFFYCGTARCQGRGELVTPIEGVFPLKFLVIYPGIKMSTKKVYENLNLDLTKYKSNLSLISALLKSGRPAAINPFLFNRLEYSALQFEPELSSVLEQARQAGYTSLRVSGSGSSLFQVIDAKDFKGAEIGNSGLNQNWEAFVVTSSPVMQL